MLHDLVLMKTYIRTAGLFAALPAFHIIGGVYCSAFRAGKVLHHLLVPRFVSRFPDAFLRFPQLDPVRPLRLEQLQGFTGILRALAAKIHPFPGSASRHRAEAPAVKASFFRAASIAVQFLNPPVHAPRYGFQSCRLLRGPNIDRAGGAKEPAYGGKFFVNSRGHCIPFKSSKFEG
jgi:hypothetical protein